nr:MAG TPA: hypothetical protein [Caudoviricetes sp.]
MIRGQKRPANKGIVLRWWMVQNVQLDILICFVSGWMNATKYLFCCVRNFNDNQCQGLGPGGYNPPGPGPFLMVNSTTPSRTPPPGVAEKRAGDVRAYRYISHTSPLPPLRFWKKQGISKNECV